jgi:hypothetical protein
MWLMEIFKYDWWGGLSGIIFSQHAANSCQVAAPATYVTMFPKKSKKAPALFSVNLRAGMFGTIARPRSVIGGKSTGRMAAGDLSHVRPEQITPSIVTTVHSISRWNDGSTKEGERQHSTPSSGPFVVEAPGPSRTRTGICDVSGSRRFSPASVADEAFRRRGLRN